MSDQNTKNFTQKGFTRNFLDLMKTAESLKLCCKGFVTGYAYTPINTNDPKGNVGDVAYDSNFFYVKTIVGWKRTSLSSF